VEPVSKVLLSQWWSDWSRVPIVQSS